MRTLSIILLLITLVSCTNQGEQILNDFAGIHYVDNPIDYYHLSEVCDTSIFDKIVVEYHEKDQKLKNTLFITLGKNNNNYIFTKSQEKIIAQQISSQIYQYSPDSVKTRFKSHLVTISTESNLYTMKLGSGSQHSFNY